MTNLSRAMRFFTFVSFALLAIVPAAQAQEKASATAIPEPTTINYSDPWIYRGTDIPHDEDWLFGELDNGLRYAVRRNFAPPGQASIRIRIDAGALHEDEDERGFAHLLEHLSFRESAYLQDGQAIPTWQRLGARFGSDTNAITTATQTVYMLDLPDADRTKLDETMRLLSGMIRLPTLSEENLATELPIVLSELRDSGGPQRRIGDTMQALFYQGQRLGNRTFAGTADSLVTATSQAVRDFHARWYRPENTVIAIAGDGPPEAYAALIERYFSDWSPEGETTPEPDFGVPVAPPGVDPANPVGEVRVLVEPDLPRSFTWATLRPWEEVVDNLEYNRGLMITMVAENIINRRLESRAREGASYLYAAVEQTDISRSVDGTFVYVGPLGDDWQGAVHDVRAVIEDAIAEPPSEEEIAREIAFIDVIFADRLEQSINIPGRESADEVVNAVDIREAVASPETFLEVFRGMRDRFTPAAVHEHTIKLFEGTVSRGLYVTPQIGEGSEEEVRLALVEPVEADGSVRTARGNLDFADLPPIGEPAQAVSMEPLGIQDIDRIDYANGVSALVWKTDNEPGRITVRVRFGSGVRGFSADQAAYISIGEMALVGSGFGEVGETDLEYLMNGRKLAFQFAVENGVFAFEAETRPEDLADQLYLFAAKLGNPSWPAAPVERARAALTLGYESHNSDPISVLSRDLEWLVNNRDGRFATATPGQVDQLTPERFQQVWAPLLRQGPVEVIVFGDVNRKDAVDALSRTFGALPPREPIPDEALSRQITFPSGQSSPELLYHHGEADQAAAVVVWELGGGSGDLSESRQVEVLADVFSNRLLDELREQEGSAYSPFVVSNWPVDLEQGGRMLAIAQVPPAIVPRYFEMVDAIAVDLATNGPTEDDLQRVTEPNRQFLNRAVHGSGFWLNLVEGATAEPGRLDSIGSIMDDLVEVTPAQLRGLAQKYLVEEGTFRLAILPEGQQLASGTAGASGGR